MPALAEHADPELVKLFIEEAHEELAKIRRNFPVWDQNPLERDALVTVRRSLHTLKGSGRMVGARDLGEFAWSIENLVNRVLDNTLMRSPAILETLRAAVAALPELITQLENGTPVSADMAGISSRAHALAGRPAPAPAARRRRPRAPRPHDIRRAPARTLRAPAPPVAADRRRAQRPSRARRGARAAPKPRPWTDDTLRDIYARETATHVSRCARTWRARRSCPSRTPARGGLPRLPHALGQLEDGAGAPWHPPGRAAGSLAAPRLRQRPGPCTPDLALLGRLHGGDGVGGDPPG